MAVVTAAQRCEVRVEVRPPWPFRMPRLLGGDALARMRGGVLHRLLHEDGMPVHVRVAQLASGNLLFGARAAHDQHAQRAIARMRRCLGVDLELKAFHDAFREDPLIGLALRANPTLRPRGRPDAFEALTFAVTEQLIEYSRAATIQRRLVAALGRRDQDSGLRDAPDAAAVAAAAPARLASFDLAPKRAVALIRVAREVASGRVDLDDPDPLVQEAGWRRLDAIPEVGSWTIEMLALTGQRRMDQIPAGDLGFLKLVGRIRSGGDPRARATEAEVREFFARYAPWQGLAGIYAHSVAGAGKLAI